MGICAQIAVMGGASLAGMAAEKIANECGKQNIAQYISIFTSSSIAGIALKTAWDLVNYISGM